jgi:hypothetical protein
MNLFRKHWFDIGGVLSVLTILYIIIYRTQLTNYELIMWISLVSLFFHQLEEYRIVGTFPGMVNKVLFRSDNPDRFPLNPNTAFYINVFLAWGSYFLAAILAEKAIWLGIATIMVSIGNTIAHTFVFNIKGKTVFNAGMVTSLILFAPITFFFFKIITVEGLATITDYVVGILLGIVFNVVGVLKLIDWLKNYNTKYLFPNRNLLPQDRYKNNNR